MKEKLLLMVPVYSMSKDEFDKRWDKYIQRLQSCYVGGGWDPTETNLRINNNLHPQQVWQYNQIVGYIEISLSSNDICFDLYMPINSIFYAKSTRKKFATCWMINGFHFRLQEGESNEIIFSRIMDKIAGIAETLVKGRFVDLASFKAIGPYIDWNLLIRNNRLES